MRNGTERSTCFCLCLNDYVRWRVGDEWFVVSGISHVLNQVLIAIQVEFLASFLENIGEVGARVDFDGCASQIRGDDHDVRRHGGGWTKEFRRS